MNTKTSLGGRMRMPAIVLTLLVVGLAAWLADIPIGYYQFKQMCEKEGGLRSYANVEPNVGWWASSELDARGVVQAYPSVPFARFRSEDGTWKDVKYEGGYGSFSKFAIRPADEVIKPRYRITEKVESVETAIRLRKNVYAVLDEFSNQVVFQSTRFIFTWTNDETTLLGRSDSVVCPTHEAESISIKSFLKSTKG